MLAYEMDGKPLPRVHGAPLRLVIPEMYGYKNVKWVNRIELVPKAGSGYWEELGYDNDAWVGRSNGYSHMSAVARAARVSRRRRATGKRRVRRFSRTERALHWGNALGFFVLLASGLVLYLPSLAVVVGRRPLVKEVHLWSGIGWVAMLALIVVLGDRRGLARTVRDLDAFDGDDAALAHGPQARAAGSLQRRAEAEHGADRGVHGAVPRLGRAALARRAQHASSASRARCCSTTA